MNEYIIMTDSSCDLPQWKIDEIDVCFVPLTVDMGGKHYINYLDWRDIDPHAFYDELRAGKPSKTSAANVDDFKSAMTPYLEAGKDILYIGFSTGLSGTYNAGCVAAQELVREFPERKILTVDSLSACLGQGLLVTRAAEKRLSGASLEETAAFAQEKRLHICHWFTVDDLFYLHRGGRVSKTTAIVGSTLGIKPVMHVDNEGRLIKVEIARGRKLSIKKLAEHMKASYVDLKKVYIGHGDCLADAEMLAGIIKEQLGVKDILINYVGPVIGSHSGPGTLALFFDGKER